MARECDTRLRRQRCIAVQSPVCGASRCTRSTTSSPVEERRWLIGEADAGVLVVVFTLRERADVYRIISARPANRKERIVYEQSKRVPLCVRPARHGQGNGGGAASDREAAGEEATAQAGPPAQGRREVSPRLDPAQPQGRGVGEEGSPAPRRRLSDRDQRGAARGVCSTTAAASPPARRTGSSSRARPRTPPAPRERSRSSPPRYAPRPAPGPARAFRRRSRRCGPGRGERDRGSSRAPERQDLPPG